jgi:hypothetical protein
MAGVRCPMLTMRAVPTLVLMAVCLLAGCAKKPPLLKSTKIGPFLYTIELVALNQPYNISGIISDEEGKPIDNAYVSIYRYPMIGWSEILATTETDKRGSYSILLKDNQLPNDVNLIAIAEAVGYGRQNVIFHYYSGQYRINMVILQHRGSM